MNVSFIKAMPSLVDDNLVKVDFILEVLPAVRQHQLYDLCGSTLSLMFDLSVPYASAVIEPLLNVSSIGNLCPPLRALKSMNTRGFTCSVGEVLNMDTNDVPRCCKYNLGCNAIFDINFSFQLQYIAQLEHLLVKNKRNVHIALVVTTKTEIDKDLVNVALKEPTHVKKDQRVSMTVFLFVVTVLTLQLV